MKLWGGRFSQETDKTANDFQASIGFDQRLYREDIEGSLAHAAMLARQGIISPEDERQIRDGLRGILADIEAGKLEFSEDNEDIHMNIETFLTQRVGSAGKRLHTARSRNDQVLVDLKLFSRAALMKTVGKVKRLFDLLQARSEECKDILIPGYTHLQVAMPSSFGLWFGAYAESLTADMSVLKAAWEVTNRNPLGSAAGYGSSAPLDRTMTTRLLGFADLDYNVVYAQMGRGKTERIIASAYGAVAETLGRLAFDCCMYASQNFGFIHLPDRMTTGSSIMPHKKNPDVFELVRAHCNKISGIQNTIRLITTNLPSGYFRDMQLIKEVFIPMFKEMDDCLDITAYAVERMEVEKDIMDDPKYRLAFTVEEVNRLVAEGVPFRDAYRQVGIAVQNGEFEYSGTLHHTHEGSIGNLCNAKIAERMDSLMAEFGFEQVKEAVRRLTEQD